MHLKSNHHETYWLKVWRAYKHHPLGYAALWVVAAFILMAVYAPFLASSKPLVVNYNNEWYFPLFRYLFFKGFFTKGIDLFFNVMIFTLPVFLIALIGLRWRHYLQSAVCLGIIILQCVLFLIIFYFPMKDPSSDPNLAQAEQKALLTTKPNQRDWNFELNYMNDYKKLNLVLKEKQRMEQQERLKPYFKDYSAKAKQRWVDQAVREKKAELLRKGIKLPDDREIKQLVLSQTSAEVLAKIESPPTLWAQNRDLEAAKLEDLKIRLEANPKDPFLQAQLNTLLQRQSWLTSQEKLISSDWMPLVRPFHWEDDAGGQQALNAYVSWWDLTRINRKDLVAALIFGTRISLVVGIASVVVAYLIGIPIGAFAGYYGGTFDIVVSRLLEIWESMPVFFMLLMVVAVTQTKSVFLVIAVIGIFGWPGFSRYVRGEFFKQRNLPYVEACRAMGFSDSRIMFMQLLPNAIPPLLTLMPFAVMGAISTEAGLSFLGLGEEGSCSWGVLMDEGRTAFPGEAYLLWPPALLLTILLVAIALVGDSLRDALDPKLNSV